MLTRPLKPGRLQLPLLPLPQVRGPPKRHTRPQFAVSKDEGNNNTPYTALRGAASGHAWDGCNHPAIKPTPKQKGPAKPSLGTLSSLFLISLSDGPYARPLLC